MKPFIWVGSSIMVIVFLVAAFAFIKKKNDIPEKHIEVVLRDLGHQLLLTSSDSTSRVLPIKKLNDKTYRISFQNHIGFVSDTLINLVQRTFAANAIADDYVVNLKECTHDETVLAFELNSQSGNLTPCRGRKLEINCYAVEIELLEKPVFNFLWFALLLIPLSVVGLYAKNKVDSSAGYKAAIANSNHIPLGRFEFYPAQHMLKLGGGQITLTDKETRALNIFAAHIDQVVERERLMKEIWEDEGVVVISRNVDVLVSKLRKKLSGDESIRLVNVPGRGYKLVREQDGV